MHISSFYFWRFLVFSAGNIFTAFFQTISFSVIVEGLLCFNYIARDMVFIFARSGQVQGSRAQQTIAYYYRLDCWDTAAPSWPISYFMLSLTRLSLASYKDAHNASMTFIAI